MESVKHGFTVDKVIKNDQTKENINIIKLWANTENIPLLTDEQILLFLIKTDEDVEETKSVIKTCYYWKNLLPEVFLDRKLTPNSFEFFEICAIPKKTEDGCVILIINFVDYNYKKFNFIEYMKVVLMALEAEIYHEPINGVKLIFDLKGVGFMHLTKLKFNTLKGCVLYLESGTPVKLKEVHCINSPSLIDKVLRVIKTFANKALLERVYFHTTNTNMDLFHQKHIPKEYLPSELGGTLSSSRELHKEYITKLTNLDQYFVTEEMQRCS